MAAAAIAPTVVIAASDRSGPSARHIDFVIFDEHFEDSVAFADELIARGAQAFSTQQDLGRLWFGELGRAFTKGASIAGLTMHSELLICSSFTRQHGARARYEGEHDCRGSDVLTHSLRINDATSSMISTLVAADVRWPRTLAASLASVPRADSFREESCRTQTRRSATHPGSLFSWLIA
jgi:hypothetical protein